jgi:hypothetical protein
MWIMHLIGCTEHFSEYATYRFDIWPRPEAAGVVERM